MTYKADWVTGDILTAAQQNALAEQAVSRFADAAARDAAITSPTEGQFCYLTGTNALQCYNGSAWVQLASFAATESGPIFKDYGETTVTNATSGSTETFDLENGNVFDLTLTDNCTLTFSNPPTSGTSGSFTLILRQDGTGSRTVTWPASVDWADASAPTLTTDASAVDVLTFITVDGGTIWLGFVAGQDFS